MSGIYTFYTTSDDGSLLSVDGSQVVDNDGDHGMLLKSGVKALVAGKQYKVEVRYFQKGQGAGLIVQYSGPDQGKSERTLVVGQLCEASACVENPFPPINFSGWSAHTKGLLANCEGDCDRNTHCAVGLKCHQRNAHWPVPGCVHLAEPMPHQPITASTPRGLRGWEPSRA